jgi:anti-sigma B factor antagonist
MATSHRHNDYLQIERRVEDCCVVVRAAGEIDMDTAPLLREELAIAVEFATPGVPVVADLRDIIFFGSSGIAALLEANRLCRQHRTVLHVVATALVRQPLELLGLREVLRLCPTITEALRKRA